MRLDKVRIQDFRNIRQASLDLGNSNFLTGLNGQGKTNVLEAIYCLSVGSSFRERSDEWLIRLNQPWTRVEAELTWLNGEHKLLEMIIQRNETGLSKVFKLGGNRVSRKELLASVWAVIFSPDDVKLLRYQPIFRRSFLDYLASRLSSTYLTNLSDYTKAVRQRNHLLMLVRKNQADPVEILAWDKELSKLGTYLIKQRAELVGELSEPTEGLLRRIMDDTGKTLQLVYKTKILDITPELYLQELASSRDEDIRAGRTSFGPHRDDLTILLDTHDARHFASQGEFRSIILALKIAEGKKLEQMFGEKPVYLLDDVFSELDEPKSARVVELLNGAQAIFTTTTSKLANGEAGTKVFRAENGRVTEEVAYELAKSR